MLTSTSSSVLYSVLSSLSSSVPSSVSSSVSSRYYHDSNLSSSTLMLCPSKENAYHKEVEEVEVSPSMRSSPSLDENNGVNLCKRNNDNHQQGSPRPSTAQKTFISSLSSSMSYDSEDRYAPIVINSTLTEPSSIIISSTSLTSRKNNIHHQVSPRPSTAQTASDNIVTDDNQMNIPSISLSSSSSSTSYGSDDRYAPVITSSS